MKKIIKQIWRFGIIGVLSFVIDYTLLYIITEFAGINYLVSSAVSFTVSVIFNYILSIKWVFSTNNAKKIKNFILFVILSIVGLGINQFIMWFLVEAYNVFYLLSKVFATLIVMIYNFITRKIILEKS